MTPRKPLARLPFADLLNARDLGGHATRGGGRTRWGTLVRSDDLCRLTPEGVRDLLAYGLRTVIDLRWPAETKALPSTFQHNGSQVRYIHVSLLGDSEEWWGTTAPAVPKEMWNCSILDHSKGKVRDVMRAIAQTHDGVVLFHCAAGKDRTGVVASLLLALADTDPAAIAEDYVVSTENVRDFYLAAGRPEEREAILEGVRCPPEQVHTMLAHLESRYGGTAGYLRHIGLEESEITRIRARLREPAAP